MGEFKGQGTSEGTSAGQCIFPGANTCRSLPMATAPAERGSAHEQGWTESCACLWGGGQGHLELSPLAGLDPPKEGPGGERSFLTPESRTPNSAACLSSHARDLELLELFLEPDLDFASVLEQSIL